MYLGLELLGADVRYCEAAPAALGGSAAIDVKRLELATLPPVLAEAERSLRVLGPPLQTGVLLDAEHHLQRGTWEWPKRYAEVFDPLRSTKANPRAMSIAVAYATPPSVCRGLSKLIPIRAPAASGATAPQPSIYALEAPFALALELLASRQVELPATLVLITPGIGGSELTRLALAADGPNLRLEVRAFAELPAEIATIGEYLADRIAAVFDAADENPRCFAAEDGLTALPAEFAALGGAAFEGRTLVSGDAFALGAARYAAIRENEISGLRQRVLTMHRLAPRPVGLIGANQAGEGVWRLLFPAGQPYDDRQPRIAAIAATSGTLMLAEIAAPPELPPPWLWHSDWPQWRVIVHTARYIGRAPAAGHQLQLKRDKPQGISIWTGTEYTAQWIAAGGT